MQRAVPAAIAEIYDLSDRSNCESDQHVRLGRRQYNFFWLAYGRFFPDPARMDDQSCPCHGTQLPDLPGHRPRSSKSLAESAIASLWARSQTQMAGILSLWLRDGLVGLEYRSPAK
jgi:hypothetical protein